MEVKKYPRQKIIDAINEGKSDIEIARAIGCTRANANLVRNNGKRHLKEKPNMTDRDFARKMRCSEDSAKLLRQNLADDIPQPKRGRPTTAVIRPKGNGNGDNLKDLTYEQLWQISLMMYKKALTYPQLEKENRELKKTNREKDEKIASQEKRLMKVAIQQAEFETAKRDGKTFGDN